MIKNLGIDQALFDYLCDSVEKAPFYRWMGINLVALGAGQAEVQLTASSEHTNLLGFLHGGALMAIADAAMGNAIRSLGIKGVTADCSTTFISPARLEGQLLAAGRVIKVGKRLVYARAEVYSDGELVADVKGTFANMGTIDPAETGE